MNPSRSEPLRAAQELLRLSVEQVWLDYVALGGTLTRSDIEAFLDGDRELSDHEYDVLVQAINEHFMDHGGDHPLPYADDLPT